MLDVELYDEYADNCVEPNLYVERVFRSAAATRRKKESKDTKWRIYTEKRVRALELENNGDIGPRGYGMIDKQILCTRFMGSTTQDDNIRC